MYEYKVDRNAFVRRTRRRVIFEVSVFLLLTGFFLSNWSKDVPGWLELSVFGIVTGYIVFSLAYYRKAEALVSRFYVRLLDNALSFPGQDHGKEIPYQDLAISKVTRKGGEVVEIRLKTSFGQIIRLQGLLGMKDLYENIATRLAKESQGQGGARGQT